MIYEDSCSMRPPARPAGWDGVGWMVWIEFSQVSEMKKCEMVFVFGHGYLFRYLRAG